ncbi:MAG: methyltransferase domain-containing protein [Flavobacteriales bacterium]|nr:methyltransferase domain-containing protein [Flavobacteriales bacterium]
MDYVGTELELFQYAVNWKRYWSAAVAPYVSGGVLDVGSGIGANASHLWNERITSYTFLEPDAGLLARTNSASLPPGASVHSIHGTTRDVAGTLFDTILYIDVLEHIEEPEDELNRAADLLAPGGYLIILVPAFQILFSPFDEAVGHHRRYDRGMLRKQLPHGLEQRMLCYMDSVGLLLSLGNRLLLSRAAPTVEQIRFWDTRIIPLSRSMDPLIGRSFGRSLIGVYRRG